LGHRWKRFSAIALIYRVRTELLDGSTLRYSFIAVVRSKGVAESIQLDGLGIPKLS
jgi:hypothetical protein